MGRGGGGVGTGTECGEEGWVASVGVERRVGRV